MTIVVDGTRYEGPIVDLSAENVDGARLQEELGRRAETASTQPTGTTLYDRIGRVHPQCNPAIRPALALALRTQRIETPVDRALATAERTSQTVEVPEVSLAEARSEVVAAGEDEATLRERVARLGGRVTALRETGGADPSEDEAALQEATTALAEAQTDHIAAKQRLTRARKQARAVRDRYERRRRIADKVANRRQDAHAHLVRKGWEEFRRAVEVCPLDIDAGSGPAEWDGPGWVAAVALVHLARLRTPIIVEGKTVRSIATPDYLGTPIIRI